MTKDGTLTAQERNRRSQKVSSPLKMAGWLFEKMAGRLFSARHDLTFLKSQSSKNQHVCVGMCVCMPIWDQLFL